MEINEHNDRSNNKIVVVILTCNDEFVCDECKILSKMTFAIDEALETMPIPNKCTNENCGVAMVLNQLSIINRF